MVETSACRGTHNLILVATENNSVYAFAWTYSLTHFRIYLLSDSVLDAQSESTWRVCNSIHCAACGA